MIPAMTNRATTTTGTTTAIAVLPPELRPFCSVPSLACEGPLPTPVLEAPRVVAVEAKPPVVPVAAGPSRVTTEVMMIGVGVSPLLTGGVNVTMEVATSVVVGGADDAVTT